MRTSALFGAKSIGFTFFRNVRSVRTDKGVESIFRDLCGFYGQPLSVS